VRRRCCSASSSWLRSVTSKPARGRSSPTPRWRTNSSAVSRASSSSAIISSRRLTARSWAREYLPDRSTRVCIWVAIIVRRSCCEIHPRWAGQARQTCSITCWSRQLVRKAGRARSIKELPWASAVQIASRQPVAVTDGAASSGEYGNSSRTPGGANPHVPLAALKPSLINGPTRSVPRPLTAVRMRQSVGPTPVAASRGRWDSGPEADGLRSIGLNASVQIGIPIGPSSRRGLRGKFELIWISSTGEAAQREGNTSKAKDVPCGSTRRSTAPPPLGSPLLHDCNVSIRPGATKTYGTTFPSLVPHRFQTRSRWLVRLPFRQARSASARLRRALSECRATRVRGGPNRAALHTLCRPRGPGADTT
jgi:hypothetical protein